MLESSTAAEIDKDYNYRFNRLPNGVYSMSVQAPGYITETLKEVVVKSGAHTIINISLKEELKSA